MKPISIIIPVFNEAHNIVKLYEEIRSVCRVNNYEYEIVIVDDGSIDDTFQVISRLSQVKYIQLRKNFGQTAALDAGIKNTQFEYLVFMDGDGQNDPKDIPSMIDYMEKNDFDIVSGWRKKRKDPLMKKIISYGAHSLRRILIHDGIHDSGCTLKVYKKECFNHINLYGEMHRFIPALLKIKGFKVGEIVVNHRPRTIGKTRYNWKRTVKGFLDMLSVWFWNKYAIRPLHLLGSIGMIFGFGGFLTGLICVYLLLNGQDLSNTVYPLLSAFLIITGIQLFVAGLMADILSKTYYDTTSDISYSIKKIFKTGSDSTDADQ